MTWDGLPIASEPPFGATVIVTRPVSIGTIELLCLHRHRLPADGDWAWGPPSGCRFPGEDIGVTARRELAEETSIVVDLARLIDVPGVAGDWTTFTLGVPFGTVVTLSDEHDRSVWLTPEAALALVAPEVVRQQIRVALTRLGLAIPPDGNG